MANLENLLAIEEIKTLKARYMRFVDTKDWAGLRSLFTDDATFDAGLSPEPLEGPDQFVAWARASLMDAVTVHHGHCPEIEITSPASARGIWAMEDRLLWPETGTDGARWLNGFGHYHETYRHTSGGWKIDSWCLTRLRVDTPEG
ncbi:nuclear transport factor 2 family protein [Novosphingobium malaysiense]|uniref:SnoaL-like domain-containing protein n=1 Tax=Novosphingobium malaysiense TaxID=1348853 RepID=A0A0B1ZFB1_9SPHN|nr:nuclear transport factor 2 family protein [Novosphingobium malaysiense]KHK89175.1 hypothetical protein LK12_21880 [Novosphingobium malaysiense]